MTPRLSRYFLAPLLAAVILGSIVGCSSDPPPTPPPPVITSPPLPSKSSIIIIPSTEFNTTASSAAPTPSITPTLGAVKTDLNIIANQAVVSFPDKIAFSLKGTSSAKIKDIQLVLGTNKRSMTPETVTAKPDFKEGQAIDATWDWFMKKTGSIPPGATITWKWILTDSEGNKTTAPQQTTTYNDSRFNWNSKQLTNLDICWHDQSESMINELLMEVDSKLSIIQLGVNIPTDRRPKVFVYRSSQELRDAVLFEQQWTGAMAFLSYNIILTAVDSSIMNWAKNALPHEITHLIVEEAVFGPFGNLPTWINEGLASYAEGDMNSDRRKALDQGITNNQLISIRSLSGSFPTVSAQALLAYAESTSLIKFLISRGGWDKMRLLLATFKEGATQDNALLKTYSMDVAGLESYWKESIGVKP
jgi:hypothetical protein